MPFENNFFDKIIFTHVLEHVPNPTKAISEIYRVLKNEGVLYLEIPAEEMEVFLSKNNPVYKKSVYNGFHKTHYTLKKLKNKLSKFKEVKYETIKRKDIVFWFLWGKFISLFNLQDKYYIEDCGQIHCVKYDKLARQFSRLLFILNIILSPVLFRQINCEYRAIAIK
jgi:SAM-dependent methyltransferase